MYSVIIHDDAVSDLDELFEIDEDAASIIFGLIEQIEADQDLLDRLSQHGYRDEEIDVSRWSEQWHRGRNLWRMKCIELERLGVMYRIIYAFTPRKKCYQILAIVSRDFNYEAAHPITKRIIHSYNELE